MAKSGGVGGGRRQTGPGKLSAERKGLCWNKSIGKWVK